MAEADPKVLLVLTADTHRFPHFAGPDSYFHQAVDRAALHETHRKPLVDLMAHLDTSLMAHPRMNYERYLLQWDFLKSYIRIRLALAKDPYQDLINLVEERAEQWSSVAKISHSNKNLVDGYNELRSVVPSLFATETWTYAQFACLAMLIDLIKYGSRETNFPTEKTPLLLVTSNGEGYTIELVAQRIPGPAGWVVPHWFLIGKVNLGSELQLCRSINDAMNQTASGIAIRWWLQAKRHKFQWHGKVDERAGGTDSVTVPAACVAKALAEDVPDLCRPLLDGSHAASGKLVKDGDRWLCDAVKGLVGKVTGAREKNIRYYIFPDGCEQQEKIDADDLTTAAGKKIVFLETFDEVYRHLLKSSNIVLIAKRKVVDDWDEEFVEVETHSQFIERSTQLRTFDRADATEQIAPLPGTETISLRPPVSLDDIFEDDGTLKTPWDDRKSYFLVRQPFRYCEAEKQSARWDAARSDQEPEIDGSESGIRAPTGGETDDKEHHKFWRRITRQHLVECAVSEDPSWKHLALVCGPGLGKTTNFKYLAAAVNRHLDGRHKWMAIDCVISDLQDLNDDESALVEKLVERPLRKSIRSNQRHAIRDAEIEHTAQYLYEAGRILFLLDSLDQADHRHKSEPMFWIEKLVKSSNKVWVSGRPYAFSQAQDKLSKMCPDWQFMRVGQLDEPEARQLIETGPKLRSLHLQ